ncbi:glycosyltransferase family 2 protein [Micromonospora mirobrigensis]|uniref:Glycosyltransferase, GT2 family n=1 Tax=Micromonospora mirobrigensis TaxID=262898 RepID=A0A1C4WXT4_9ACTN|nr:glycosyltransferase [Micromonospora mirobrigensis]SCF01035.1 Glycosyltransferase, GT2 family [Micromonospora mirobrigensis]
MDRPRLSVVVPAHENGSALDATLHSLTRQSLPPQDFEVVVGDDGSTVPLEPVVAKYADRLRASCVRSDRNRGRSANRNAAAARAQADTLMFLDADTVAHPRLLERHRDFHAGRAGRPGVLLGQRYDLDWAGADAVRRGEEVVPAMLDAERGDPRLEDTAHPQRMGDFPSAPWVLGLTHNASVDRESFRRVGGFDEAMIKWGFEDLDFFYRVFHLHGAPPELFRLDADALSYHLPHFRKTSNGIASMDNMKYLLRKHLRYDVEVLYGLNTFGRHLGRIRIYGAAIEAYRRLGLGRPEALPAALRDELATAAALVVGNGVATLPLGAGSHTFDHATPPGPTNSHLLGTVLQQFRAGTLKLIVNVDLWRCFLPDDLPAFLTRGLLKADRIELVASHREVDQRALLPVPLVADLDYLVDMLDPHFAVSVRRHEAATLVTVR